MTAVTITRTEYTLLAPAEAESFTAQARGPYGMEVLFATAAPAVATPGARVPAIPGYGVTRANGDGALYAKIPADSPPDAIDTVIVIGIPETPVEEDDDEGEGEGEGEN